MILYSSAQESGPEERTTDLEKAHSNAVFEIDTEKTSKKVLKKVLTNEKRCAKINKLSLRQRRTLKIEQHDSLQI